MHAMRFLNPGNLIILAGAVAGILAALMTNWGNPLNRGLAVACFIRDITGALGFHQAPGGQYIRPEIPGFVLGAFLTSIAFREFRARGGSSPMIRFLLGFFVMLGALVFLGCNTHVLIRLAGGDLNAVAGLAGLIFGIVIGVIFIKRGFNLGRSHQMRPISGLLLPLFMVVLLLSLVFKPDFVSFSVRGAASRHAAIWISVAVGLVVGFLAQRTRLCFMAGWRNLFLIKDAHYFGGIAAFFVAALITNYVAGNFGSNGYYHWGFTNEPAAVDNQLWNFMSMVLVGMGTSLLGGCLLRQTILSGEGDNDAGFALLGLFVGAPVAQNFMIVSRDAFVGVNTFGPVAVIIGLIFCTTIGFVMREKIS